MKRFFMPCVVLFFASGLVFAGGGQESDDSGGAESTGGVESTGLGQYSTSDEYGSAISGYHQAPMLDALVSSGDLPPVEERLPLEPAIVEPVEKIGKYGGTWRRVATRFTDNRLSDRMGYEPLVRRARDASSIIPNVAKSWEIVDGGKSYVFYLREGMKWSDGEPFTADDFMFWYEDIALNKELTPSFPNWGLVDGVPMVFEKIDDYAFKIKFVKPYGIFLDQMTFRGMNIYAPKHYLKQFHPSYTDAGDLQALAEKEEFEAWYQLFGNRNNKGTNPDLPVINSWKLATGPPATIAYAERNPYYWKIDPQGNQLPYIDEVQYDIVESGEIANFKAMAGEIDMHSRYMSFANYTVFQENAEKEDYTVVLWKNPVSDVVNINLTHEDPVIRAMFMDRNFRLGLSYAINRQEIADIVYLGVGEPWQALPVEEDPYFVPPIHLGYDVARANEYLDAAGMTSRGSDGYRLRPDGKPFTMVVETYGAEEAGGASDEMELLKEYWEAVGIKTTITNIDRSLWTARRAAGEFMALAYLTAGIHWVVDPNWFVPTNTNNGWAPLAAKWNESQGAAGEEPAPEIRQLIDWYEQMKVTVDEAKRTELGKNIIRSHAENVWIIGLARYPAIAIVKNDFKNVATNGVQSYRLMTPGYLNPEQFFFDRD